jgi:hypothetical protein
LRWPSVGCLDSRRDGASIRERDDFAERIFCYSDCGIRHRTGALDCGAGWYRLAAAAGLEAGSSVALLPMEVYSHSMVLGGLDEMSSATRFTPSTSLMMRLETVSRSS